MIWPPYMAARHALAEAERMLAREPRNIDAAFTRACLLDQLGEEDAARLAYLDVLAQDMTHAGALAQFGRLLAAMGYTSAALTVFRQGVTAHPENPAMWVMLANLLRLAGQDLAARKAYLAALRVEPAFAQAHQGMSYLLDGVDDAEADRHRRLGFTHHAVSTGHYRGKAVPVEVLHVVSARGGNIDLRAVLDDRLFRVHTLVAEHAVPGMALPPHHVTFNAIGDADKCADALVAAVALLAGDAAKVLNPPDRILPTGRFAMSSRLAAVDGARVARIACVPRAALDAGLPEGFDFPVLLRSPGYHTGQYFCRVPDRAGLGAILAALPGEMLLVIECLDTRGADGAFRKYRAMFIGGAILPLHLAISADWKVHYFTARMAEEPSYRAEEARFLGNMTAVVGKRGMACLAQAGQMLGLDYGGIDFCLAKDGGIFVFEANATMVIVRPPAEPIWAYRLAAAEKCLHAAQALIRQSDAKRT